MASRGTLLLALLALVGQSTGDRPRPRLARPAVRTGRRTEPLLSAVRAREQQQLTAARSKSGTLSIGAVILQVFNNVKGAGVLTLAAGMAVGRVGWLPAAAMCILLGVLAGTTFYLVGAACEVTGEETFKGLWSHAFSASSAWVVDLSIALMCFFALAIYAGILGDVTTQLLARANVVPHLNRRGANICLLSLGVLLPLCNVELARLGLAGLFGVLAIGYTVVFTAVRYLDGSYALPSGAMLASLPPERTPSFEHASLCGISPRGAALAANLGLSYIAHYNAPAFYRELKARSAHRFAQVSAGAFGLLAALNLPMMLMGFATFGDRASANIISSYAKDDLLAVVGRAATALSLAAGFPLGMAGLREALCSLLPAPPSANEETHRARITLAALTAVTALSAIVPDIGPVVGVAGALIGSFIAYVLPALLYGRATAAPWHSPVYLFLPLGAFIGLVGVHTSVSA